MRPRDIQNIAVKALEDWVTNVDRFDLKENIAYDLRGGRHGREGLLFERDFGTILQHTHIPQYKDALGVMRSITVVSIFPIFIPTENAEYLVVAGYDNEATPNLRLYVLYDVVPVTAATNATPIVITPGAGASLYTWYAQEMVGITGVTGNTAANGVWQVQAAGGGTFNLIGSVGNGAYTGGGYITKWEELTRIVKCKVNGTPGTSTKVATIDTVTDYLGNSITLLTDELIYYIAVNQTGGRAGQAVMLEASTATTITGEKYVGSNGLGWLDNDDIWLYRMTGIYDGYNFAMGTDPHIRWLPVEAQNKVNAYIGNSSLPPVMQDTLQIRKSLFLGPGVTLVPGADLYFYPWQFESPSPIHLFIGDTTYLNNRADYDLTAEAQLLGQLQSTVRLSTATGWYIDKAQLTPYYASQKTRTSPYLSGDLGTTSVIGEGMRVTISNIISNGDTAKWHTRLYITALYRGRDTSPYVQESDPIFQTFVSERASTGYPRIYGSIGFDLAKLPKNIYGFRIYHAHINDSDISSNLGNWFEDATEYLLIQEFSLDGSSYNADNTQQYSFSIPFIIGNSEHNAAAAAGAVNISSQLNHTVDTNRSRFKPRFAVKGGRDQKAIIVADESDATLRLSSYDGDGVHEDDSFPDVTVDNGGMKQQIPMNGRGELMGLAILEDNIWCIREREIEVYDLQGNQINLLPIDFYARKSLTVVGGSDAPRGLFWTGISGMYWARRGSGGIFEIVSRRISNRFDGSQYLSDGTTPIVSDAARRAVIAGYDFTYNEIWAQVLQNKEGGGTEYVCYRYNVESGKMNLRELNLSAATGVKMFSTRKDKLLTIVASDAILKYPNRAIVGTAHQFEDSVSYDGISASRGIPTKLHLVFGGLTGLNAKTVVYDMILDYIGTVVAAQSFDVNLYANGELTSYDAKQYVMTDEPTWRRIAGRGAIETLEIIISFPSANLSQFKRFDLQQLELGVRKLARIGNT